MGLPFIGRSKTKAEKERDDKARKELQAQRERDLLELARYRAEEERRLEMRRREEQRLRDEHDRLLQIELENGRRIIEEQNKRERMLEPTAIRDLRELVRSRHELDMFIWKNRFEKQRNKELVEEKMLRADAILKEIETQIEAWDTSRDKWSVEEWTIAKKIIERLSSETVNRRVWMENPPFEERIRHRFPVRVRAN